MRMTIEAYQALYCSSIAFGMRKALQAEQGTFSVETVTWKPRLLIHLENRQIRFESRG